MRLTKLKLAGFKSFVDPTTVALPGQLVGVVGPNGCGKSNIMDAVRWVLGESKASELRGESMQDVIFNGSTGRKPVSRASVELIFDNSLGRAMGQWSQYAELSVKRVLTRSGQSDYFINNLKVRRKDITDLFLGTGLGPRAYAIIGQGMISRIIEARPDDLRVFLEEAAGVTRYKERRKETQGRLEDTRENLLRVEDIRLELASQMEKLGVQAEIARQYRLYQDALTKKQQLLWMARKRDALAEAERIHTEMDRCANDLEAQLASLRETEAQLETAREAHFQAGDGLHEAQSELYAANAEVARLEAEIRHRRDAYHQLKARMLRLEEENRHWQEAAGLSLQEREEWEAASEESQFKVEELAERLEMAMNIAPQVEETHAQAEEELARLRQRMAQAEQRLQVELTHKAHAQRSLQSIVQRQMRLDEEMAGLTEPDADFLAEREDELAFLREELAEDQEKLAELQHSLPEWEQARKAAQAEVQRLDRERAAGQSRLSALEEMQAQLAGDSDLTTWLNQHGIESQTALWQDIQVEPGWEVAVEAALGPRLQALSSPEAKFFHRPPSRLGLRFSPAAVRETPDLPSGSDALLGQIRAHTPSAQAVLSIWLHGVRAAATLDEALAQREALGEGECWVTREGDCIDPAGILFFAPEAGQGGMLARQREIDLLHEDLAQAEVDQAQAEEKLAALDDKIDDAQAGMREARQYVTDRQQKIHALQLEVVKLNQAMQQFSGQHTRLMEQRSDLQEEQESEREREMAADEKIAEVREALSRIQVLAAGARQRLEETERAVREERARHAEADRALREAQFRARECQNKLQDIYARQATAERELKRIQADLARCEEERQERPPDELDTALQTALDARHLRELALAKMREQTELATQTLRTLEEQRLRTEQGLEPLRTKLGELKLKEQAALLNAEQFSQQLLEVGADETALAAESLEARPSQLQGEITRLQNAMTALGPVNLAALDELQAAEARKGYLDAQAADLNEAMQTLENAIRRIDRESRELLQHTFDTVNGHFGQLFPTLFGGGRAELIMTGEEILDAGVQVVAQPPGKKNSTIHLLSGGEKALTAIALVFSMFQLNPAPFCLLDEVDAPLDDSNTERFCGMVRKMSGQTQFLFISHNKIAMEMAEQLVGVTMQESGVSRVVEVDIQTALKMRDAA